MLDCFLLLLLTWLISGQPQGFGAFASKPAELQYAIGSLVSVPQTQPLMQPTLVSISTGSQTLTS